MGRNPTIRALVCVLTIAGCGSSHVVDQQSAPETSVEPSRVQVVVVDRPTTDSTIALANLDAQITGAERRLSQRPDDLLLATHTVGLLLSRAHYVGSYDDFARADALSAHMLATHAANYESWLLRADYLSAVHRFAEALALVERAEQAFAPEQTIRKTNLWLAIGEHEDQVLALREQAFSQRESYQTLIGLAPVYAARGEFARADALYVRALQVYRDVSPFPIAWVSFQRGVMWSEMAARPDLGAALYREALRVLDGYVVAQVHLAEIEFQNGKVADAIARLRRIEGKTSDPEPKSRLASFLAGRDDALARKYGRAAEEGYEALLARYGPAFRDHAAEFFLGYGNDPQRALDLALADLSERQTPRGYLIALEAAAQLGHEQLVCRLDKQAARFHTHVNLTQARAKLAAGCD